MNGMFLGKKNKKKETSADTGEQRALWQRIADKTYPGITLFARDVNLPAAFAEKYVPGLIIKERGFVDASIRFMGMAATHRYVIRLTASACSCIRPHPVVNWD